MMRATLFLATIGTLAPPAWAQDSRGMTVALPSGGELRWIETLHDDSGGAGLTWRFRFVMADLAQRVPSTSGPASESDDVLERAPIDIDTESAEVTGEEDAQFLTIAPVPEDGDTDEAGADAMIDDPALPAALDMLAQDPVHDDVVWLCENWALPRAAAADPRPVQIVISLSDKETPFGSYDPDALQLFEAFRLPSDADRCEWEPW